MDFILWSPMADCPPTETVQQYRTSVDFAHHLSATIITHLQGRYRTFIRAQIEHNRHVAQRGAVPGIENDVTAYLNVLRTKQNVSGVDCMFYIDVS